MDLFVLDDYVSNGWIVTIPNIRRFGARGSDRRRFVTSRLDSLRPLL